MPYKIRNNKLRQRQIQLLDTNCITLQSFNSPDGSDYAIILDEEFKCEQVQAGLANGSLQCEKMPIPAKDEPLKDKKLSTRPKSVEAKE